MLLEAQRISRFVRGHTQDSFSADEKAVYAVIKAIENMGEAARQLLENDPTLRDRHPEIPWSGIIGMRNLLAHQYFRVDTTRVWQTAIRDVPQVAALIEPLAPPAEPA